MKNASIVSTAVIVMVGSAVGLYAAQSETFSGVAAATGDDVRIVRSFRGNKGPGWKDSIVVAGAVGPRHVVDFNVAGFVVHDKASGKTLRQLTTREFWQRVEPAG